MHAINQAIVFLVGIGAPATLYADYLDDLQRHLPQTKLITLEWWNQNDFGISALLSCIGNSEVILIGHSGGSVLALQALAKRSELVKKIIMLDSHFLRTRNNLPTVSRVLDIMLKDNSSISARVRSAYAPIISNSLTFNSAFKFAIDWVNASFDQACSLLNTLPQHSALQIGFTNSSYQILGVEDEQAISLLWKKFSVDVKFLPMNHFDLIDSKYAAGINQLIADWLRA